MLNGFLLIKYYWYVYLKCNERCYVLIFNLIMLLSIFYVKIQLRSFGIYHQWCFWCFKWFYVIQLALTFILLSQIPACSPCVAKHWSYLLIQSYAVDFFTASVIKLRRVKFRSKSTYMFRTDLILLLQTLKMSYFLSFFL